MEKTGRPGQEYNVLLADDRSVYLGRIIVKPDGVQPISPQARSLQPATCQDRSEAVRVLLNHHLKRSAKT
jgi:hypothetical protein